MLQLNWIVLLLVGFLSGTLASIRLWSADKQLHLQWSLTDEQRLAMKNLYLLVENDRWQKWVKLENTTTEETLRGLSVCRFYCVSVIVRFEQDEDQTIGKDCKEVELERLGRVRKFKIINMATGTEQVVRWRRPAGRSNQCHFHYTIEQRSPMGGMKNVTSFTDGYLAFKNLQMDHMYEYTIRVHLGARMSNEFRVDSLKTLSGSSPAVPYNIRTNSLLYGIEVHWDLPPGQLNTIEAFGVQTDKLKEELPNTGQDALQIHSLSPCRFHVLEFWSKNRGRNGPKQKTCGVPLSSNGCGSVSTSRQRQST